MKLYSILTACSVGFTLGLMGTAIYNENIGAVAAYLYALYYQASYFDLSQKFDAFRKTAAETAIECKDLLRRYQDKDKMVDKLLEDIKVVFKK